YTILIHAEIEHYLESIALRVLAHVRNRFISGVVTRPLLCVLATFMDGNSEVSFNPDERLLLRVERWNSSAEKWMLHCYGQMNYVIQNNNGLMEKNIKKMFGPFGLEVANVDSVFLANLDDLGRRRGAIAHNHYGMYQLKPAADHRQLSSDILAGLPDFLEEVRNLR
ncbi:MAG: HEPN domain-containing protein, partial [Candidatus Binatia bacterium]